MEIHSTVCRPVFEDTGGWTLMPQPKSFVDRGSGSAHSLIVISSGSSPQSLTFKS